MPMPESLYMKLVDHLTAAAMGSRRNKTCGASKLEELQIPKAKCLSDEQIHQCAITEWHTDW